jgi:hypothetical protein
MSECNNSGVLNNGIDCAAQAGAIDAFVIFRKKQRVARATLATEEYFNNLYSNPDFVGIVKVFANAPAIVAPVMDSVFTDLEVSGARLQDSYTLYADVCAQKNAVKLKNVKNGYAFAFDSNGNLVANDIDNDNVNAETFVWKYVSNTPTGAEQVKTNATTYGDFAKDVILVDRGVVEKYVEKRIFIPLSFGIDDIALPAVVKLQVISTTKLNVVDDCLGNAVTSLDEEKLTLTASVTTPAGASVATTATVSGVEGNTVTYELAPAPTAGSTVVLSLTQKTDENVIEVLSNNATFKVANE